MLWSHLLLITSRPCLQILPNFDLRLNFQNGETVFESEHKGGRRLQAYVERRGRGKEKGMWSKTKRPMCLHVLSKHLWLNYWEPEVFEERMETDKNTKIVEHPLIEEQIGAREPYSSKGFLQRTPDYFSAPASGSSQWSVTPVFQVIWWPLWPSEALGAHRCIQARTHKHWKSKMRKRKRTEKSRGFTLRQWQRDANQVLRDDG